MIKLHDWLKKNFINLLVGVGLFSGVAQITPSEETITINATKNFQEEQLQTRGKYKHIPRTSNFQVDEYVDGKGEKGYTISLWKEEDGIEYFKRIDYGNEKRNLAWTIIKDNRASTSPQ